MIETVDYENKEAILTGDLNCNYLVHNDHKEIKEILYRNKLKQSSNPQELQRLQRL